MYDGRVGRWLSVDPERQYASPYENVANNPIDGFDPTGGSGTDWYVSLTGAVLWQAGNAPSIVDNGQTFTDVGSTYAFTVNNGGNLLSYIGNSDGSSTLLIPNEFNVVRFPESGDGFARYTNNVNDLYTLNGKTGRFGDNYASPATAVAFYNTIQKFHKDEPGITIHYGDISAYKPSINLGHKTHNSGNSVDIRYFDCVFRSILYQHSAAKFTSVPGVTLPSIPLESLPLIPG